MSNTKNESSDSELCDVISESDKPQTIQEYEEVSVMCIYAYVEQGSERTSVCDPRHHGHRAESGYLRCTECDKELITD